MLHKEPSLLYFDYKTGLLMMAVSFIVWGFQPMYWALRPGFDTMFLMLWRICTAAIFCLIILKLQGKMEQLKGAFRNKEILKREIPAALLLAGDWFVYLFAVRSGKIQQVSFGYYCMPIVIFFFGAVIYREKLNWKYFVVLGLLVIGILMSVRGFGGLSFVALFLALDFAVYSAIKKGSPLDGIVSTSMEILIMFPFALAALLLFYRGEAGLGLMTWADRMFVLGAGFVTCLPMLTYAVGVSKLPMFTTALCHYSSPTFTILCSLILGETVTKETLISFLFIWAGLILYTILLWKENKSVSGKPEVWKNGIER